MLLEVFGGFLWGSTIPRTIAAGDAREAPAAGCCHTKAINGRLGFRLTGLRLTYPSARGKQRKGARMKQSLSWLVIAFFLIGSIIFLRWLAVVLHP